MTIINSKDSAPLVSIICRTVARLSLRQALESVFRQTWSNIELVLVDARGQGLQSPLSAEKNLPVNIVSTGQPLNRPAAANAGLDHANGQWLLFLDDDDWIAPEHIRILMQALQDNTNLVAYSNTQVTDQDGHATGKVFAHAFDPVLLMRDNYIPIHSVLFSRTLLEKGCRFDETLGIYEDWDFWLQCAHHGEFIHVDADTAFYRQGGDSATALERDQEQDKYLTGTLQANARIAVLNKWLPHWRGEELNRLLVSSAYVESIKAELSSCTAYRRELEQQIRDCHELLHWRENQSVQLQEQLNELSTKITELKTQITELNAHRTNLMDQLSYVRHSFSWRLTRPFRWLGRHLKRSSGHSIND